jgi:hypothetical protein
MIILDNGVFLTVNPLRSTMERHQTDKGCQSTLSQTTKDRIAGGRGVGGRFAGRAVVAMIIIDLFGLSYSQPLEVDNGESPESQWLTIYYEPNNEAKRKSRKGELRGKETTRTCFNWR